jgi:hypothetical protein
VRAGKGSVTSDTGEFQVAIVSPFKPGDRVKCVADDKTVLSYDSRHMPDCLLGLVEGRVYTVREALSFGIRLEEHAIVIPGTSHSLWFHRDRFKLVTANETPRLDLSGVRLLTQ